MRLEADTLCTQGRSCTVGRIELCSESAHPSGEVALVDGLLVGCSPADPRTGRPEAASPRPWRPRVLRQRGPPDWNRQPAAHRHARLTKVARPIL